MSKTVDERKAKWIAIATKWSKEHPGIKFKSGFYANSEPITIRRMDNACRISTGPRIINTDNPFERDLFKLIFFWNYRDDGYTEDEIQEIWKKTPWGSKNEVQAETTK